MAFTKTLPCSKTFQSLFCLLTKPTPLIFLLIHHLASPCFFLTFPSCSRPEPSFFGLTIYHFAHSPPPNSCCSPQIEWPTSLLISQGKETVLHSQLPLTILCLFSTCSAIQETCNKAQGTLAFILPSNLYPLLECEFLGARAIHFVS